MATPLTTAQEAMRCWMRGAADGDWSGLLQMLDPDVTFQVPVDEFAGPRHGSAEAARFFAHLSSTLRAQLTVTGALTDGDRVAFEVSVQGSWHDRAFTQALCLVFVFADQRIREFREYLAWPGGLESTG
jgi:ketosteroid isomerase-like protein